MAINFFDGIVYINLMQRKDRKKSIERELLTLGAEEFHRMDAHYDELNGCRGCVYSHIKALDFALEKGWRNALILEDDCIFLQGKVDAYIRDFICHFEQGWDVFFLGTKLVQTEATPHPAYVQVRSSLRAHAYAVNGPYLLKLRNHFASTFQSMQNDLFFTASLAKALDRQWTTLQLSDRWFAGVEMVAQQRKSFSDIEKAMKSER